MTPLPPSDRRRPRAANHRALAFSALLALSACQSPSSKPADHSPAVQASSAGSTNTTATSKPPPAGSRSESAEPIQPIRGRIVSRNDPAQFVVVELIFSPVPELGRRLEVYRDGNKVGELRASRWNRGGLVAADILHGDAQPGDDVKAE